MTPEQFAYWLQGYVEIRGSAPTSGEWEVIKDHLATVFKKVTPDRITIGPGIAEPYRGNPNPYMPPQKDDVYTTPYTWPTTKPEVICSTINAAGGVGFSSINIKDMK